MRNSETVQVRVDEQTKTEAKKVLSALHLSMSEAICLFLRQVVLHQGIPFEIKLPNALTAKTLRESEEGIDLHRAAAIEAARQAVVLIVGYNDGADSKGSSSP